MITHKRNKEQVAFMLPVLQLRVKIRNEVLLSILYVCFLPRPHILSQDATYWYSCVHTLFHKMLVTGTLVFKQILEILNF